MKATFASLLGIAVLAGVCSMVYLRTRSSSPQAPRAEPNLVVNASPADLSKEPETAPRVGAMTSMPPPVVQSAPTTAVESTAVTNKLQRLAQIRETFRLLAAGEPTTALRAAKQLADDTERETALLTLVTEWTHGELSPARQRAQAIATLGLEAGLGLELTKNPQLAVLWADELTDGPGRSVLLQRAAVALAASDPAAAFALSAQVPENERRRFSNSVYAGWAANDTAAALQWAGELADPAEREAALQAIREVAPVGIGAEMRMQDGYAVVNRVLPGTPAELSGQLRPGDRIVALAQGDKTFVDARSLSLAEIVQMIRGAPGTSLQLQVLPADAPLNSLPRTVSIMRDQIKYKR